MEARISSKEHQGAERKEFQPPCPLHRELSRSVQLEKRLEHRRDGPHRLGAIQTAVDGGDLQFDHGRTNAVRVSSVE